jgi:chaperonin GroES
MKKGNKELVVVGDRILIVPDVGEDRSNAGLYLPKWAIEKESIQAGRIVEVGQGAPLTPPDSIDDEPLKSDESRQSHQAQQAQVGDFALFLRKAAIEVKFDGDIYLIVPQAALLLLIRDNDD